MNRFLGGLIAVPFLLLLTGDALPVHHRLPPPFCGIYEDPGGNGHWYCPVTLA